MLPCVTYSLSEVSSLYEALKVAPAISNVNISCHTEVAIVVTSTSLQTFARSFLLVSKFETP